MTLFQTTHSKKQCGDLVSTIMVKTQNGRINFIQLTKSWNQTRIWCQAILDNSKSYYNLPRSGISREGWTPSGLLAQDTMYKQISLWLSTKIYLFKCSVGQQSYDHTSDDDKI